VEHLRRRRQRREDVGGGAACLDVQPAAHAGGEEGHRRRDDVRGRQLQGAAELGAKLEVVEGDAAALEAALRLLGLGAVEGGGGRVNGLTAACGN
jgi:hypothetical protein